MFFQHASSSEADLFDIPPQNDELRLQTKAFFRWNELIWKTSFLDIVSQLHRRTGPLLSNYGRSSSRLIPIIHGAYQLQMYVRRVGPYFYSWEKPFHTGGRGCCQKLSLIIPKSIIFIQKLDTPFLPHKSLQNCLKPYPFDSCSSYTRTL